MRTIKAIREKIGLGQPEMARILGIARSTLAQVELKIRALPEPALKKLGAITDAILTVNGQHTKEEVTWNDIEKYNKQFESRWDECMAQARKLMRELAQLEKMHECNCRLHNVISELKKSGENDPEFLEELLKQSLRNTTNCNAYKREFLRDRISHILNEATLICQLLEKKRSISMTIIHK